MKLYRLPLLSSLLILISALSLSAQTTLEQFLDKDAYYMYNITTSPSYCQNDGTIEIEIERNFNGPKLSQVKRIAYNLMDSDNKTYTNGYLDASPSNGYLRISQLPGRDDYKIFIQIWTDSSETPSIETELKRITPVEDKYIPITIAGEQIDKYRLQCRPEGSFHITVRGGTLRPPKLKFKTVPEGYTGAREFQPTSEEDNTDFVIYHFKYTGPLPQGTYEYVLETRCESTVSHEFTVYGPKQDLPVVSSDLTIPFNITIMDGEGCAEGIYSFGSVANNEEKIIRTLFETINKGFGQSASQLFPEFDEDFQALFTANYEVVVATQQEYELIKQGTLSANNLIWSNQKGSHTRVSPRDDKKADPIFGYTLPEAKSLRELQEQKELPGALLIRIKRPNSGCNDYIAIPINVDLDFHKHTFERLETEQSDCSVGQLVWLKAWNFCSLRIKYYILQSGEQKPSPSASPVHTSKDFGPAVSTLVEKRYSFEGYDPKKRYYVELDVIDLYGKQLTPKPALILDPMSGQGTITNRLYDFQDIRGYIKNPMLERIQLGSMIAYLGPTFHTYIFSFYGKSLNALAGMEITLVQAPDGYEDFQRVREEYYYRKPNPGDSNNPFGGGMIRLGETVKISPEFTGAGGISQPDSFYPFRFLYKEDENGRRVVYPFKRYPNGSALKTILPEDENTVDYMKKHPMPRGIYRLKFEHPCQPGESFYIDLNMNEPNFEPNVTKLIDPIVDYASCDEARIYPFADGRIDYAVDEQGRPRNVAFYITGLSSDPKFFYFFPYDRQGNPVDHTKFYIPIKKVDLPRKINLRYFYPQPKWQWIRWDKQSATTVNPIGVDEFVFYSNQNSTSEDNYYKLPLKKYDPSNDQDDWGEDGVSNRAWSTWPYIPWISVDVKVSKESPLPSYLRYSYVGYRCAEESGYMEFKLINIPRNMGTVILRDPETSSVVMQSDITDLTDLTVRWDLTSQAGVPLKSKYRLEISTIPCDDPSNTRSDFFEVELIDISQGVQVTVFPQSSLCHGEIATLTATNLGVPEANYKWVFDNGKKYTGRTIRHTVSAPRLSGGAMHYEHYKLTISGTKCGTTTQEGTISVSPDELWWMPRRAAYNPTTKGLITPLPQTVEGVTVSTGTLSERETYDWHNPANWAVLFDGKFYAAQAVPAPCTHVHIVKTVYNDGNKQLAPAPDLSKEVTLRDQYGEPTCADITFHSGGEVYNVPLLNYERAMVRYNFGVDPTSPGYDSALHGTDGEKSHSALSLYTSEENFASDSRLYERDKLYLMATPLYDLYAGDYSFSASPYTYQLNFTAVPTDKGLLAGFDVNFSDPSPLQSVSLAQNYNSIGLIVARDEQGFNLRNSSVITQSHGILELPYFDRSIASRFYHHTYDASTGMSRFQYFDGKTQRFRKFYSNAQRSKNAYRFIFEDSETHNIPESATGDGVYTLDVDFGSPVQETMIGNPFMSTIDLEEFLKVNHDLEPYARIVEGIVAAYEPKLKVDGQVHTFRKGTGGAYRFVSPLQAFVVKPKSSAGQTVKVLFPQTIMPLGKQATQTATLRSEGSNTLDETPLRYMSLSMQSAMSCDRVVITFGQEAESIDKMLMSMDSRYPSISIIAPEDGRYKELYNDNSATGRYRLFTYVSEPLDVTMTLSGSLLANVVSAQLIDHKSGLQYDLSAGKSVQLRLFPDDAESRLELMVEGDFTAIVPMAEPASDLTAQYRAGSLTIRSSQLMESVRIVDGSGVTRYSHTISSLPEYSERMMLSSGSYVIEVRCTDGSLRRVMLVVS